MVRFGMALIAQAGGAEMLRPRGHYTTFLVALRG